VKILVTGADGFVGPWVARALQAAGHEVVAALRPDGRRELIPAGVATVPLELRDPESVRAVARAPADAVVHLAAVASGGEALREPEAAWEVNAVGTARLAEAFGAVRRSARGDPVFLLASTAEVYGRGPDRPRVEDDPVRPCSPYAASKLAAEIAALEVHRRTGLRVVVARAFTHTGPGQDDRFVVPAFVHRLLAARAARAPVVKVGNLDPIREILHVADVADAYVALVARGAPGEIYNVASGEAVRLEEVLDRLMALVGHRVVPESDPHLLRPSDIPYLVGSAAKLRAATGWAPRFSLDQTLRAVVDAEAH
jgi:GDP-4-dehydro-6-deoxy-D-mannose reductase